MNLTTRSKRESELTAAILLLFDEQRSAFDPTRLRTGLVDAIKPVLLATYMDAAGQLAREQKAAFDEVRTLGLGTVWATDQATVLAVDIAARSDEMARDAQYKLVALGDALGKIFGSDRAESIAITEVTRAATAGAEYISGVIFAIDELTTTWRTQDDLDVCPICEPLEGTGREVWALAFPAGPPSPHPRCRCYLEYEGTAA